MQTRPAGIGPETYFRRKAIMQVGDDQMRRVEPGERDPNFEIRFFVLVVIALVAYVSLIHLCSRSVWSVASRQRLGALFSPSCICLSRRA
jgi:hypothetical protein